MLMPHCHEIMRIHRPKMFVRSHCGVFFSDRTSTEAWNLICDNFAVRCAIMVDRHRRESREFRLVVFEI